MKIMFLLDDFPPITHTSASLITYNLAQELLRRGHKIFIITSVQDKEREGREKFNGLEVFRIFSSYHPRWRGFLSIHNPWVISKIESAIREVKPDICHFHHIHRYLSYRSFKAAKKYAKAVFLTSHDVMLVSYSKLMPKNGKYIYKISTMDQLRKEGKRFNPFRNFLIRYYLRYLDKIFSVSDSLKKLLEINGIKNVETIHNGINVDEWQIEESKIEKFKENYNLKNKKVLIFSARLIEAKGGDQLIKSLSLVNEKFSDFILLVVGKKWAYTEKLKNMAEKLKIQDKVIFTGFLKNEELKIANHSADISVFPSLCFESFGMSNLEAMACKKPVVSSFFGGPSEVVIDGETGYLIDPNNIDSMAEKIIDLLKNPQKAKQFGEAGYKRAKETFSLFSQVKETLGWYSRFTSND